MSNLEDLSLLCKSTDLTILTSDPLSGMDKFLNIYRSSNLMKFLLEQKALNYEEYLKSLLPLFIPGFLVSCLTLIWIIWSILLILRRKGIVCLNRLAYIDGFTYSEQIKKRVIITVATFSVLTMGFAITGIIFSMKSIQSNHNSYCGYHNLLLKLSGGSQNKGWNGFSSTEQKTLEIKSLLAQTAFNISQHTATFVRDYTSLQSSLTLLNNKLDTIYQTHVNKTVTMPYYDIPELSYNPLLFKNLGPTDQKEKALGSFAGVIQDVKNNLILYNTDADVKSSAFINEYSAYSTNLTNFIQKLQNLSNWYVNFNQNDQATLKFSSMRSGLRQISLTITALFCITTLSSFGSLFLLRSLYQNKVRKQAKLNYYLTFLNLFLMVIYAMLMIILYPITVTTLETCDISNISIHNESFFKNEFTYFDGMTAESLQFLSYCIHDDGELPIKYNLNTFLNVYESYLNSTKNVISQASLSINEISTLKAKVNQYLSFNLLVDQEDIKRTIKISDKVDELNKLSNFQEQQNIQSSLARCRVLADIWKLSISQCPVGVAILSGGYEGSVNFGKRTCLGVAEVSSQGLIDRHLDYKFTGCAPMNGSGINSGHINVNLKRYLDNFKMHVQSVQSIFGSLAIDLTSLETNEIQNFEFERKKIKNPILSLQAATENMSNLVLPENGTSFRDSLNCKILKDISFQFVYNLCGELAYSIQIIAILIPVTIFMLLLQTIIYLKLLISSL